MYGEQLKGHLQVLLLAVLAHEPQHGYAIINELRTRSRGAFDLAEGTVYPALHRMEREGLVSSQWADVGGRRRRLYQLTGAGTRALSAGSREWSLFASSVGSVLGLSARWTAA